MAKTTTAPTPIATTVSRSFLLLSFRGTNLRLIVLIDFNALQVLTILFCVTTTLLEKDTHTLLDRNYHSDHNCLSCFRILIRHYLL
jgi:hypothetical protein